MRAYDLGQYQRLVGVESDRITGTFKVLLPIGKNRSTAYVNPVDVTIWDSPEKHSGRVLYYQDLTAFVEGESVDIPPHMVSRDKHADVLEVMGELERVILAVVRVGRGEEGC